MRPGDDAYDDDNTSIRKGKYFNANRHRNGEKETETNRDRDRLKQRKRLWHVIGVLTACPFLYPMMLSAAILLRSNTINRAELCNYLATRAVERHEGWSLSTPSSTGPSIVRACCVVSLPPPPSPTPHYSPCPTTFRPVHTAFCLVIVGTCVCVCV